MADFLMKVKITLLSAQKALVTLLLIERSKQTQMFGIQGAICNLMLMHLFIYQTTSHLYPISFPLTFPPHFP